MMSVLSAKRDQPQFWMGLIIYTMGAHKKIHKRTGKGGIKLQKF